MWDGSPVIAVELVAKMFDIFPKQTNITANPYYKYDNA